MVSDGRTLFEQLAAIEHERWAHWQRWMHDQGRRDERTRALVIPATLVDRWERQIATPYADLSEAEKASNREQIDRYWLLIEPLLAEVERLREQLENARVDKDAAEQDSRSRFAEVERLTQENARLRRARQIVEIIDEMALRDPETAPTVTLARELVDLRQQRAAERDVIEKAKAWQKTVTQGRFDAIPNAQTALLRSLDAYAVHMSAKET
jgi:hypothetical protein